MVLEMENLQSHADVKVESKSTGIDKGRFTCHVCGAAFKTKRYLKHHTRRVHCDPVRCDLCPKELSNKKQLTRHVKRVHLKREVSNCRICGKTLKSIPGLKNHEMKCGGARKSFPCRICDKQSKPDPLCPSARHHKTPQVKKLVKIEESPMCVICRKSYHTVANMRRHMRKIHQASLDGGGISYKIQKQSEKVENIIGEEDLEKLKIKCAQDFAKKLVCFKCGQDFETERLIWKHKEEQHVGEKVFECDRCDGLYRSRVHLRWHKSGVHRARSYVCSICGNKFKLGAHLKNHMNAFHSNDKQKEVEILS